MAPFILKWWWWLHSVLALVSIELRGRNKAIERSGIYKAVGEKFPKDLISKSPVGSVPISSSFSNLASPLWTESSTMLFWIVYIYHGTKTFWILAQLNCCYLHQNTQFDRYLGRLFQYTNLSFAWPHIQRKFKPKIVKPSLFYPSLTKNASQSKHIQRVTEETVRL